MQNIIICNTVNFHKRWLLWAESLERAGKYQIFTRFVNWAGKRELIHYFIAVTVWKMRSGWKESSMTRRNTKCSTLSTGELIISLPTIKLAFFYHIFLVTYLTSDRNIFSMRIKIQESKEVLECPIEVRMNFSILFPNKMIVWKLHLTHSSNSHIEHGALQSVIQYMHI